VYKKIQSTMLKSPKKVLIVDAEQLSRDILSKILSRYLGCEVFKASSSSEALSFLQSKKFDLLIVDLVMPGIFAVKLIEKIRLLKSEISIIIVTGNANDNDIGRLKSMGVKRIVYKPIKISSLLEMVADILIEKEHVDSTVSYN
jgi:CheY-like chemotaxis protein